jgi:monofunctional biosynthetic peptidoglycan transglycosylase
MKLLRKLFLWLVIAPVIVVLLMQAYFFVQIWWWVDHNPESTSFMRQQLSALREKKPNARLQQKWVPYNRISNNLKRAIIASEDAHFSEHEGIDWDAMQKAYEKNTKKGKVIAGGCLPKTCSCRASALTCARDRKSSSPICLSF